MSHSISTEPLVAEIADRLTQSGQRLVTAESCTGGLIAAAITSRAGSSAWFERGWVTYSNAAKTEELGVDATLIAQQGAVSEAVAAAVERGKPLLVAAADKTGRNQKNDNAAIAAAIPQGAKIRLERNWGRLSLLLHHICHKEIHARFSEAELARQFNTIETLRSAEPLQAFLAWIARRPPDFLSRVPGRRRQAGVR